MQKKIVSALPQPAEITIDPATTALLLLHWQNEVVKPEGKRAQNLPERIAAAHNIEHTQAVLKASREKGMLVVHVRLAVRPGAPEFGAKPSLLMSQLKESEAYIDGTWGAEIIGELQPVESDVVVINASSSALCDNDLDMILRNNGITNLVLTGMITNFVIESTAREANNRGYFVYILEDCVNSRSDDLHNWTLNNVLPSLAVISDSTHYVAALEKAEPVPKKAKVAPPTDITTIDPATTALLLLHWQNEVVKPEGKRAQNLPERIAAAHNIEHTQAVLKASREKGMLVVHVRVAMRPGVPEFGAKPSLLMSRIKEAEAYVDGTWGAEIIGELKPVESDVVVINTSTSALCNNDLDMILRNNGITNLVLTGMVTNLVIESTARDAINRGYLVYILEDCVNSRSGDLHNWTLNNVLPSLAVISDSKAYIDALKD